MGVHEINYKGLSNRSVLDSATPVVMITFLAYNGSIAPYERSKTLKMKSRVQYQHQ
jgi:hypothetical protein